MCPRPLGWRGVFIFKEILPEDHEPIRAKAQNQRGNGSKYRMVWEATSRGMQLLKSPMASYTPAFILYSKSAPTPSCSNRPLVDRALT
jgi:hypothetical protein